MFFYDLYHTEFKNKRIQIVWLIKFVEVKSEFSLILI